MPIETTYRAARDDFARLCDEAVENREIVIIHRDGAEDVALIAASELSGLLETVHLLRSPDNASRLFDALTSGAGAHAGTAIARRSAA